jgi:hypothetical protein
MTERMAGLAAFVKQRLADEALEPAAWIGRDKYPKGGGIENAKLWSRELREYARLAEDVTFRKRVAALVSSHIYWGIEPVRTPVQLAFGASRERIVAFLMGCEVLGADPDSGAYLVASWEGVVASFLFNDVVPTDKEPGDFVVEALSIRDALAGKARPPKRAKVCTELAARYRRAIWLAQVYQGDDWDTVSDDLVSIGATARDAATKQALVADRPDLAAYWIMAHAARDDRDALADVIAHTRGTKHAAVAKLRTQLATGVQVIQKEWKQRKRGQFTPPARPRTGR